MRKLLVLGPFVLFVAACGQGGTTTQVDPRQNPVPHDYSYYKNHPVETDAQKLICNEIPSQARSQILEGNCVYVDRALSMRGYGDSNASIVHPSAKIRAVPKVE